MASPTIYTASIPKADAGARIIGFVVDSLIAVPIGLIGVIPVVGQIVSTILLVPYWLLRDFGGASIGKRIFGLRVIDYQGNVASLGKRIRRNMLFAFAVLLLAIPLIGEIGAPIAFVIVCVIEICMMASRGERFGDRDAKCLVVKKATIASNFFLTDSTISASAVPVETSSAITIKPPRFCRTCGTQLTRAGVCTACNDQASAATSI